MDRKQAARCFYEWGSYTMLLTGLNEELLKIKREIERGTLLIEDALAILPQNTAHPSLTPPGRGALTALYSKIDLLNLNHSNVSNYLLTLDYYDRRLITLRYARHKSWDAIAYAVHLSDRQCFRVHNRLLNGYINYLQSEKAYKPD